MGLVVEIPCRNGPIRRRERTPRQPGQENLGLKIGTSRGGLLSGFLLLSDAESMNFHCAPNQVLYQAEPLPDL